MKHAQTTVLLLNPGTFKELPKWEGINEVLVFDRLTPEMKLVVSNALENNVPIRAGTPEALESIDSFVTGANT